MGFFPSFIKKKNPQQQNELTSYHVHSFVFLGCTSGYRHIQLRTQHNEALEVSSLFIYSHRVEECPTGGATPSSLVRVNLHCWDFSL